VLLAGTPIFTALLSAVLGQERVGPRAWIGALATVAGIAIVVSTTVGEGGSMSGNLLMVGASAAWAIYTVGGRPLVEKYGPIRLTAWTLGIGTVGVVLAGVPDLVGLDLRSIPAGAWGAVVYAGALSVGVAYLMWNYGVRHIGNTRTAVYSNLVPVMALVVAWVWLKETPSPAQVIGAVIIIAGVSVVQRRSSRRRPLGVSV
jgi:drug/metabolite transporter (DMT)-like permease